MSASQQQRNIVLHVNFNDAERYGLVLNNVENICDYYRERDTRLDLRVVCHGPGLHLLRVDTSPVRERLLKIGETYGELGFYACRNTIERMTRAEGSVPELVAPAIPVDAGLAEIAELQIRGFSYLKP